MGVQKQTTPAPATSTSSALLYVRTTEEKHQCCGFYALAADESVVEILVCVVYFQVFFTCASTQRHGDSTLDQ